MGIVREAVNTGVDLVRVIVGVSPIERTPELMASKQRGGGDPARYPHLEWYRGTSRQTCGLYPFVASSSTPMIGVPVGKALDGTGTVCADPINWFETGLISAPSCMVLGLNGLGKSSLVRRMVIGLEAQGAHTMVLGDIKPDYRDVVEALGGQIIAIGHGRSGINPLDAGNAAQAAAALREAGREDLARELEQAAHERKKTLVCSLLHVIRRTPPTDREETIIDEAVRVLEDWGRPAKLSDLLDVVREAPEPLRLAALDRGDMARYRQIVEDLEASLTALLKGRFGAIFAADKTVPMMTDRSVVFDVSALLQADEDLQAAVLLASWSYGFATVEVSQVLADAGLAPRARYMLVMDELWRILRTSPGMVERVDSLTRLNRTVGIGQMMITHTISDFTALASEADRKKAQGFIERSKMLFIGGVPKKEIDELRRVFTFSDAEQSLVSSWNAPGTYDSSTGARTAPVGQGKFLLKTSDGPGFPFYMRFTPSEFRLSNTNQRWDMK